MASETYGERRVCNSCSEELAHSAYYRHLHDKTGIVCPGKEGRFLGPDNASVISSESSVISRTALENNWQNLFAAEVGVSTYGGRSCTFVTGGKERA